MRVMLRKSVADEICRYWGFPLVLKSVHPTAFERYKAAVGKLARRMIAREEARLGKSLQFARLEKGKAANPGDVHYWGTEQIPYVKLRNGKWRRKWESHDQGSRGFVRVMRNFDVERGKCKSFEELDTLIHNYLYRFRDDKGMPLPQAQEFYSETNKLRRRYKRQEAQEREAKKRQEMKSLADVLKTGESMTIWREGFGEIIVPAGNEKFGLKHIIGERLVKDGKSVDEITELIPLVLDAAKYGDKQFEAGGKIGFDFGGIRAVITKNYKGTEEKWVITGYEIRGQEKTATDSINAARANYRYAPERSYLRKQVGAVVAHLGSIDNRQDVSSEKIAKAKKTIDDEQQRQAKEDAKGLKTAKGGGSTGYTARLRKELLENLTPYFDEDIENEKTGVKARLSSNSVKKISCDKAIQKSKDNGFKVGQHFKVVNEIVELYKRADFVEQTADRNGDPNVKSMIRFQSPVTIDGKEGFAYITVKEAKVEGKRIYSLKLTEINKASLKNEASNAAENSETVAPKHTHIDLHDTPLPPKNASEKEGKSLAFKAEREGKSPYDGVDMDGLRSAFDDKTNRYVGKRITNKATGRSVVFSKTSQKDVRSHTDNSVNNGFTPYEHFEVANQVIELFQNATLENEHEDTKHGKPDLRIERFLSQPVTLKSGREVQACITVKHSLNTDGRRIYAIEAIEIKEALEKTRAKGRQPNKSGDTSREKSIPQPTKKSSRFPRLMLRKAVARAILRQE